MNKITNFLKPSDRRILNFSDPNYNKPYSNRMITIAEDVMNLDTSSTKSSAYKNLLKEITDAAEETLEFFWVGIKGSSIMTVGIVPFNDTNNRNSSTAIITGRDYRGLIDMKWSKEDGSVNIKQDLTNIVVDTNDIDYIYLPSYSETLKDDIETIIETSSNKDIELTKKLDEVNKSLISFLASGKYRSYLTLFSSLVKDYPNNDSTRTKFVGCVNSLNLYDSMWETYRDLLTSFFPKDFKDTKLIIVTKEVLESREILDSKTERMFTVDELNFMLAAIGLQPIDPNNVKE